MNAGLIRFLTGLSRRERLLLGLLAFLALPLALVQGIALPLLARQEAARATLSDAEALHAWVVERQIELALLPAPAHENAARAPVGLSMIEASLIDAGLRQALVTLAIPSGTSISLRFDGADYAALMGWLDGLERAAGYQLASLRLARADTDGLVDAEIRLEPLP